MEVAPIRVFVLAGQSNVLGQGSLMHLEDLIVTDGVQDLQEFRDDTGWVERDDVFVTFNRAYGDPDTDLEGPLTADGYGSDSMTFGPELGFGFHMGDTFTDDNVVIFKGAGVGALAGDWAPPSSNNGNGGDFYNEFITGIRDALNRVDEIAGLVGAPAELCGIVWWQGYADVFEEDFRNAYEENLGNWISDVRNDLGIENLPIIIGQMGGQGSEAGAPELEMRQIQQNVADANTNVMLSNTAQFMTDDVATNFICDEDFHYYCNAQVVVEIGRQFASDMLTLTGKPFPVRTSPVDVVCAPEDLSCSLSTTYGLAGETFTLSADFTSCPPESLDLIDTSQDAERCECTPSLVVESIEEQLSDCDCYVCSLSSPGFAVQCQEPIIGSCHTFSCDGTCNGEYIPTNNNDNSTSSNTCAALTNTNATACTSTTISDNPASSNCVWCADTEVCRNSDSECPDGCPTDDNTCQSFQNETACSEDCVWCGEEAVCRKSEQDCPGQGGGNQCSSLVENICTSNGCRWCPDEQSQGGVCTSARGGQCPEIGGGTGNGTICSILTNDVNCTSTLECRWCEDNSQCTHADSACEDESIGIRGNPCEDADSEGTCPAGCLWCLATSECRKPSNDACSAGNGSNLDPCKSLDASPDCEADNTCQWCDAQSTCKNTEAICEDPSGAVGIELGEIGAKFAIQDDGLGPTDPNAVSVSLQSVLEVAGDGSEIPDSFVDLDYRNFEVTQTLGKVFEESNINARKFTLAATIEGVGTVEIELYTMLQGGTINSDAGESWTVNRGDVKFNIILSDWSFCDETPDLCGGDGDSIASEFIDVAVRVQGSLPSPEQNETNALAFDLGGDVPLLLSDQVAIDDFLQDMPEGFPRVEDNDGEGSNVFVFRIPRFTESAIYDPIIGFHESLISIATEAPTAEAVPTAAPVILVPDTESPTAAPVAATTNAPIEPKDGETPEDDDDSKGIVWAIIGLALMGIIACGCGAYGYWSKKNKDSTLEDEFIGTRTGSIDGFDDEILHGDETKSSNIIVGSDGGYNDEEDDDDDDDEDSYDDDEDDDEDSDEDDDDDDEHEEDSDEDEEDSDSEEETDSDEYVSDSDED